jgi:hypothetical protein
LTLSDSILASNGNAGSCASTSVTDGGYNVEDDDSCGLTASGSMPSVVNSSTVFLATSLAANGSNGPQTLAIGPSSSAFEEVPPANCSTTTDERGDPRPGVPNSHCDAGAYEYQAVVSPTAVQDTSPNIVYDHWQGFSDPSSIDGAYRRNSYKAVPAIFKFWGTAITWVTHKGPDQGIAAVAIDGTSQGKVDLYAASSQSFSKSYAGLASKKHSIVVTVTGSKNPLSTGKFVAVDAFIVGFNTTDDSSNKITYGSWKGANSTSACGGTYRISSLGGATTRLSFTGSRVDWITATGPSAGMASVSIDNVSMSTVDLYAPTVNWQVLHSFAALSSGPHYLVVTVLGTKSGSSMGTAVIVDAFVVYNP